MFVPAKILKTRNKQIKHIKKCRQNRSYSFYHPKFQVIYKKSTTKKTYSIPKSKIMADLILINIKKILSTEPPKLWGHFN